MRLENEDKYRQPCADIIDCKMLSDVSAGQRRTGMQFQGLYTSLEKSVIEKNTGFISSAYDS